MFTGGKKSSEKVWYSSDICTQEAHHSIYRKKRNSCFTQWNAKVTLCKQIKKVPYKSELAAKQESISKKEQVLCQTPLGRSLLLNTEPCKQWLNQVILGGLMINLSAITGVQRHSSSLPQLSGTGILERRETFLSPSSYPTVVFWVTWNSSNFLGWEQAVEQSWALHNITVRQLPAHPLGLTSPQKGKTH